MKTGDKVKCINSHEETRISSKILKGEILTIRSIDTTSTGTWISFMEHRANKYCVYPCFGSWDFELINENI